jgi:hypothetical protein
MGAVDHRFHFSVFLKAEAASASADDPTPSEPQSASATGSKKQSPRLDGTRLCSDTIDGTDDHREDARRQPDEIDTAYQALEYWLFGATNEQGAAPDSSGALLARMPITDHRDTTRPGDRASLVGTFRLKFEQLQPSLAQWFNLPQKLLPLTSNKYARGAVLAVITATTTVVLADYVVPKSSNPKAEISDVSKLAVIDRQPVDTSSPSLSRTETPPIAVPGITLPDAFAIQMQQSSETDAPKNPPLAVSTNASSEIPSESTSFSEAPTLGSERPLSDVPIPTNQHSTSSSLKAGETTASLPSPKIPAVEGKTAVLHRDTRQPHVQDGPRQGHDQMPSKEAPSCTANVFAPDVHASASARQLCADEHLPFIISLRCLFASVVCPNQPVENGPKVIKNLAAARRAP